MEWSMEWTTEWTATVERSMEWTMKLFCVQQMAQSHTVFYLLSSLCTLPDLRRVSRIAGKVASYVQNVPLKLQRLNMHITSDPYNIKEPDLG